MEKQNLSKNIFSLVAEMDENTGQTLKDGEVFDIPIGALALFEMVVYVNQRRVPVTSSSWTVLGRQIVGGTVVQNLNAGGGATQNNPVIPGGYGGNPAVIGTTWIQEGRFAMIIQGTYVYRGRPHAFTAAGTAVIHAPQFNVTQAEPDISHAMMDNDFLRLSYSTGIITYACDPIVQGGQIGFLQTVNGIRLRGDANQHPTQMMGAVQNFIDNDGAQLFYFQENAAAAGDLQTNDTPSQLCDGQPNFVWYRIGSMPNAYENYSMFVAYKAPIRPGIVESYILVRHVCNWNWHVEGIYEGDEWASEPATADENCNDWIDNGWALPTWANNKTAITHNWSPFHQQEE